MVRLKSRYKFSFMLCSVFCYNFLSKDFLCLTSDTLNFFTKKNGVGCY